MGVRKVQARSEDRLVRRLHHRMSRERGSRSLVVAVVGLVTKGPPSSGARFEKATSGMSLGRPARGKSFRKGK
ncbi:MAG: hypothetical protein RIS92_2357 [Verrucomicrobiota bacterium]